MKSFSSLLFTLSPSDARLPLLYTAGVLYVGDRSFTRSVFFCPPASMPKNYLEIQFILSCITSLFMGNFINSVFVSIYSILLGRLFGVHHLFVFTLYVFASL